MSIDQKARLEAMRSLFLSLDAGKAHLSLFGHPPRDSPLGQLLEEPGKVRVKLFEFLHLALALKF